MTVRPARESDGPLAQRPALHLHGPIRLTLDPIQNRGTIDPAPVYPRERVRRALELSAKSMIIVHTHLIGRDGVAGFKQPGQL